MLCLVAEVAEVVRAVLQFHVRMFDTTTTDVSRCAERSAGLHVVDDDDDPPCRRREVSTDMSRRLDGMRVCLCVKACRAADADLCLSCPVMCLVTDVAEVGSSQARGSNPSRC